MLSHYQQEHQAEVLSNTVTTVGWPGLAQTGQAFSAHTRHLLVKHKTEALCWNLALHRLSGHNILIFILP